MDQLFSTLTISSHGMRAQGERIRVVAENLANANSAPEAPGQDPYTRQVITFKNVMDRELGHRVVKVDDVEKVKENKFIDKYMPDHPAADPNGYVKMPNVNSLIEMMDMREAQRSYEANLGMVEQSRDMMLRTIDVLR
ncbi:MAG: flagellar basal body rod protein FlgC [Bdellovibrionales bacterium]